MAARIKFCSTSAVAQAVDAGSLSNDESGKVLWNASFGRWIPPVSPHETASFANACRTYTTTIRMKPLQALVKETMRTAKEQGRRWDIVPVSKKNVDLILNMQRGSLDGNVYTTRLEDDVLEALRLDEPVYQKRIYTSLSAYHQGLHPAPEIAPVQDAVSGRVTSSRVVEAASSDTIHTFEYNDDLFVVLDDDFREWKSSWREDNEDQYPLFSQMMMNA